VGWTNPGLYFLADRQQAVVPPTSRSVMLLCLVPCNYALL